MTRVRIHTSFVDRLIAKAIARRTTPGIERINRAITVAASEKIIYGAVAAIWLITRFGDERTRRRGSHALAAIVGSALLQHLLKQVVAQQRPDRRYAKRGRRGIPHSGKAYDAFPSGHAMNLGALAPALARLWPEHARAVWTACLLVASTRVFLLAHWASDVVTGFSLGMAIEGALCPMTGAGEQGSRCERGVADQED
jgi:membrane-associated phospholipid phosphatase